MRAGLDQVIVLCYSNDLAPRQPTPGPWSRCCTCATSWPRRGRPPVVTEMLDDRNRVLAQVAHVDDVVVSGEIVSLLVTQLSEDHRLEAVFAELLGADGSEIYLRPAEWYVLPARGHLRHRRGGCGARSETALGLPHGRAGRARAAVRRGASTRPSPRPSRRPPGDRGRGARRRPRRDPLRMAPGTSLAGPARRDRVEPRPPAHLDHRPAADRRGVGVATALAAALDRGDFDLVLSSPRQRARRDRRLAGFPEPEVDADLAEWDYGDYEGITTAEIRETVPGWTVWSHPTPGRRDRRRGRRRGSTGSSSGSRDAARAALVFGHGHALRALTARWLGLPVPDGRLFRLDTATVSVLGFERDEPRDPRAGTPEPPSP